MQFRMEIDHKYYLSVKYEILFCVLPIINHETVSNYEVMRDKFYVAGK